VLSVAILLAGCGGGGGGGGGGKPTATYTLSGAVSGLDGGEVVLAVTGAPDVRVTANGNVALAAGLRNGAAYTVSVKTPPVLQACAVTNGTGKIAGSNVSNVQVACARAPVSLAITAPADDDLVPVDGARTVTAAIGGTLPAALNWQVLPAGMAANATVTPVSSSVTTAVVEFRASVPGDYTLRLTSDDDDSKVAQIELRVHTVYTAVDSLIQNRTYLQANGTVKSESDGAPVGAMKAIAQGHRFGVAVRVDGTVVSWGLTTAPVPSGLTQVKQVAAGDYFAVAIREDGTMVAWGKRNSDAEIPESLANAKFKDADATNAVIAAILEDGTITAWSGDTGEVETLPAAWQGRKFTQVCGTVWHVMAIDVAGTLFSWKPLSSVVSALDTVPATSGAVTAVYCGSEHAALVQSDGRVRTWGDELGPGGAFDSATLSSFPRIKGATFYSFGNPQFLTEGGAIVDIAGYVVTSVDDL
jgi:hypothetical protein